MTAILFGLMCVTFNKWLSDGHIEGVVFDTVDIQILSVQNHMLRLENTFTRNAFRSSISKLGFHLRTFNHYYGQCDFQNN